MQDFAIVYIVLAFLLGIGVGILIRSASQILTFHYTKWQEKKEEKRRIYTDILTNFSSFRTLWSSWKEGKLRIPILMTNISNIGSNLLNIYSKASILVPSEAVLGQIKRIATEMYRISFRGFPGATAEADFTAYGDNIAMMIDEIHVRITSRIN